MMFGDFFACLVIGHLVGDYILQNDWMALNKSKRSLPCLVHSMIYSITVFTATYWFCPTWWWLAALFLTHYPIDRYMLADKFMRLKRSASIQTFFEKEFKSDKEMALTAGFTAFVYVLNDNTSHLLLMVACYYFLR